jgi:hypothetical protein
LLNEDEAVNVNPPYGPLCSIVQLLSSTLRTPIAYLLSSPKRGTQGFVTEPGFSESTNCWTSALSLSTAAMCWAWSCW